MKLWYRIYGIYIGLAFFGMSAYKILSNHILILEVTVRCMSKFHKVYFNGSFLNDNRKSYHTNISCTNRIVLILYICNVGLKN